MQGTLAAAFPRWHAPGRAFAGGAAEAGETLRAPGSPGLPQGPFERPARSRQGTPGARPPMGGRRSQGLPEWAAPEEEATALLDLLRGLGLDAPGPDPCPLPEVACAEEADFA